MDAVSDNQSLPASSESWHAQLDLHFRLAQSKTKIAHLSHYGPLRVQRPFYPEEDGTAHVYLLHPPGGVAGGDVLNTTVDAGENSHALLTTPAATKLYRSVGPACTVEQRLTVQRGATLEWLPQETIAFRGAQAHLKTMVHLEDQAKFFGWEVLCLGRPAAQDDFESGRVTQRLELYEDDKPLYVDRLMVGDGSPVRGAAWGMNGHPVVGTLLSTTRDESLVSLVRHSIDTLQIDSGRLACSALSGVLVTRYVGDSVPECWAAFVRIWETIRPVLVGRSAVIPRIWNC